MMNSGFEKKGSRWSAFRNQDSVRNKGPERRLLVVASTRAAVEKWRVANGYSREMVIPITTFRDAMNEGRRYQPYIHAYQHMLPDAWKLDDAERLRIEHELYGYGITKAQHIP